MEKRKVCQRCGIELGPHKIKWCETCASEIRRERDRMKKRKNPETARRILRCPRCGVEFVAVHGNRVYCDECAYPGIAEKRKPGAYREHPSSASLRSAPTECRMPFPQHSCANGNKNSASTGSLCTQGEGLGTGDPSATGGQVARATGRGTEDPAAAGRPLRGREILKLVRFYGPPYETYGKLKAYVDRYGKLPPRSCLRSAHPNPVDQGAFRPTPGERWF